MEEFNIEYKPKELKTWITKDGEEMKISEMSEAHVKNALRSVEARYVKYNNMANKYADKAYKLQQKMFALDEEVKSRGFKSVSLSDLDPERFGILANDRRWREKMNAHS